ncbi:hypothetical protein Vi05172_g5203 [Venturia inaequalis]|nr:hypothetical protein Vi05172_g5203 [Venturia inaequalis]
MKMLFSHLHQRTVPSTTASNATDTSTPSSSTQSTPLSQSTHPASSSAHNVSPTTIAIPVLIGVFVILGLGFCIWRMNRRPGSWRRSDEEIAAMGLGVGGRNGEEGKEESEVKGGRERKASLDSIEVAKESIRRNEVLRVGGEGRGGEEIVVPPMVFVGSGMAGGTRS